MKKNYIALSLVAVLVLVGLGASPVSFAQTSTLSCSVDRSPVQINQTATLTASGGDGNYVWSGQNLSIGNPNGQQFEVSWPDAGSYLVTVTSDGQSATCTVVVVNTLPSSGNLVCSPSVQSVTLGQTATFVASGGDGAYLWSAPGLTITNPTGSGFSANYASAGTKQVTVTSDGLVDSCTVNVVSGTVAGSSFPNFPNTGGGYAAMK